MDHGAVKSGCRSGQSDHLDSQHRGKHNIEREDRVGNRQEPPNHHQTAQGVNIDSKRVDPFNFEESHCCFNHHLGPQ